MTLEPCGYIGDSEQTAMNLLTIRILERYAI